jgi:hypothetical protein
MENDDVMLQEMRQGLDILLAKMRDVRLEAHPDTQWVNVEASTEPQSLSRFEVFQTYLLLRIVEQLETLTKR